MRLITRTLVFVIVILGAFWFTAENARELVLIDFAFLRVRASLPLVVFGSVLAGMGFSFIVGWRAERRLEARAGRRFPTGSGTPDGFGGRDLEPGPPLRELESDRSGREEPEPLEWR